MDSESQRFEREGRAYAALRQAKALCDRLDAEIQDTRKALYDAISMIDAMIGNPVTTNLEDWRYEGTFERVSALGTGEAIISRLNEYAAAAAEVQRLQDQIASFS